jgi:hypothetical protein
MTAWDMVLWEEMTLHGKRRWWLLLFTYLPVGTTSDYTSSMHGSLLKQLTSCISPCAAFDYDLFYCLRHAFDHGIVVMHYGGLTL